MKFKKITFTVLCMLLMFALTGCGSKTAIANDEFISKVESYSLTTTDVTSQYSSYDYVKSATVAQSSSGWQIEFYILADKNSATSMFNTNQSTFESYKGSVSSESSVSIGNYATYTLTSGGYYMHLCRVDNTLLYVRVNDTYKDTVKDIIKDLGY
jgi:uncharacterized lipoprotein YehR (DUF1307 family)